MTSTSKNIESIVKKWTSFDVKSIQHDLNVTTTERVSRADESDQSRRKLVELSRDLKKNTNEIEIDSLSKRSKITEKIHRHLSELPDPVPALEYNQTLQKRAEIVSELEIENPKLKESLNELVDVKNQELTIKQLRDKIKDLEEEKTEQHIHDKEKDFADKQRQLQNQQIDLGKKYVEMAMHDTALDHTHQDMFEYKTKQDTCSSEEELEQTSSTSLSVNKNPSELILQEETERKLREKLELELTTKEREIAALVIETQKLQSTLIKVKDTSFTEISDLENILSGKEKLIAQLESKLQSQADYDEIKRELTILKSIDFPPSNNEQTENIPKKSIELLVLEKTRILQNESTQIKVESNTNHQQLQHSCRHCSSPCLHRTNTPFLPVPSLLSSSVSSSSSNSSSSPSSPSQIYLKTHPQSTISNGTEEITRSLNDTLSKFIPPPPPSLSTKDNLQLSNSSNTKYPSLTSTMVTPTASLLSSVTTTTTLTPSNLYAGHQLSSVQCTKLHCPPTSSWSPPLSSSSGVSSIATTSTDNINSVNRTVIKSSKQTSPKSSPSSTILVPSPCPPIQPNNTSILEPLDTTYVANVVRKLLAQHNIGQRIFARYILSLSQGTVSELLSKPKCWSKLTEKGKESYRKMWCWANSEESILTLKSISPRKGMNNRSKDNPYPAISTKHTDPATQQKIVQILADAQKQQIAAAVAAAAAAANMDQKPSLSPCSSIPNDSSNIIPSESKSYLSQTPSSSSSSTSSVSSTANSPLNESTPCDQQSFLLPGQPSLPPSSSAAAAASLSMLSAFVPSLLMRTANGFNTETTTGNLMDCSSSPFSLLCPQPDNYRNWFMLQEIVRNNDLLKQLKPPIPPSTESDESEQENEDDDDEDNDDDDDDERNESSDEENPNSSDEIPLDLSMKMDSNHHEIEQTSITISNNKQQTSTKQVKTALTPLREQDTAKYRYVNTIELVQTVKDILSRYSISQRHFGEKILGLSQGSVSDILARPKQWELLTQKGREPFLRMRIFLDDPNAIKQLIQTVSTTTTTPTNTSSILLPTFCPPLPPSSSSSSSTSILLPPSLLSNSILNGFHTNNLLTRDNSTDSQPNDLINEVLPPPPPPPIASSSSSNGITTNTTKSKSRSKSTPSTNQSRHSLTNPLMKPYELPKIVLPTTMDTEQLSSQVRELLFAYSIGQRVFGEAVLNLSQGTVSEILSKPRPWHSLSVKGREPYLRMYTWFHDTGNVQKLLAWKRERDALRRSRPPPPPPPPPTTVTKLDNGDLESGPNSSILTNSSTTTNRPKRRYLFTDEQRRVLKQTFENEPYPSQSTLEQLVSELSLPINKIANWFHNSRMRAKTNIRPLASPTNKISTPSIHTHEDLINTQSDEDDEDLDNDEDDYSILPTIVPLTSSWLNGTNDSNSSTSPINSSTNIISLIDDQKIPPILSSSSSKKRKSVPQKIVTNNNNMTKKFHNGSTIIENDNYNTSSNDESTTALNQTTNESTNFVDILT